jgi:NAD(P)-dependent dehydrogenase (short-subunit alcohol dehydrogenase family)
MSSYCASKFALESFSDCLRREMIPWNLHVSIIEPGFMKTPIIRYRPGWQSNLIFFPLSMMPARLVDLIVSKNKATLLPASTYKQLKE